MTNEEVKEVKEVKIFKITLDELNKAYEEAKTLGEASQKDRIKAVVARDPITTHNNKILHDLSEEESFQIVFSLEFIFDHSIGTRGRWILNTSVNDVEVIDIDEDHG